MRRWRFAFLLILPVLTGCTCMCEDGCMDGMRIFEFGAVKAKPTTVAYCEPAAN